MIRTDHPAITIERLNRMLAMPEESTRLEAVRTLGSSPLPQRFEVLSHIAEDQQAPAQIRAWSILGLANDAPVRKDHLLALAECSPPLLRHEALRSLRGVALSAPERTRLTETSRGDDESLRLLAKLDQTTTAGTPASADAGQAASADLEGWLKQIEGNADATAGERVFFHPRGPGCYRCHEVEGRGGRVGPDLSRLARGMDRRRLVQSILQPSAEIAPQFVPWSVARTNGTVFTGILLVESQDGMQTYADAEGRSILVKSSDIEDRKPQATSIMPDNVARTLTVQEFRDLVAFLLLP
jgi:putative heme-binding domain-containing protein